MATLSRCKEILWSDLDVAVTLDAPIGEQTWYGAGGLADVLICPNSTDALRSLCTRCDQEGIRVRVLGSGANLLVADDGIDGIVVQLTHPTFCAVDWQDGPTTQMTRIGAGADLMKLVQESARRGLDGLSQLAGIPATVGGAVRMNAGGTFGQISDCVQSIDFISQRGEVVLLSSAALDFGYRRCALPDGIVLAANCALQPGDPAKIRSRVKEVFEYKKSTQPMAERSAGCMFKNPTDTATGIRGSAGRLIDEAGLKGRTIGGAYVSDRHGNFIGLRPGGRACDVIALSNDVQQRVLERTGIRLEREVVVWSKRGEVI